MIYLRALQMFCDEKVGCSHQSHLPSFDKLRRLSGLGTLCRFNRFGMPGRLSRLPLILVHMYAPEYLPMDDGQSKSLGAHRPVKAATLCTMVLTDQ